MSTPVSTPEPLGDAESTPAPASPPVPSWTLPGGSVEGSSNNGDTVPNVRRVTSDDVPRGAWVEVKTSSGWTWLPLSDKPALTWVIEHDMVVIADSDPSGLVKPRFDVPAWDDYFLDIADAVSKRAKCRRRQVGAVLVDDEHRIISTGYAGFPQGVPDCLDGACPRGLTVPGQVAPNAPYDTPGEPSFCQSSHAEVNACSYARRDLRGATIYITDAPCPNCQKFLAASKVNRAVWRESGRLREMNPLDGYARS